MKITRTATIAEFHQLPAAAHEPNDMMVVITDDGLVLNLEVTTATAQNLARYLGRNVLITITTLDNDEET
jgi:hypothetical protein